MKQTGQLDALHQLIWQMDRVTFQSVCASQCQQPVITYTTVCCVIPFTEKLFFLGIRKSYALEPYDRPPGKGLLHPRSKGKIFFTRSYKTGCLFKTHQADKQVIVGNLPCHLWRAGISPTGLSSGECLDVNSQEMCFKRAAKLSLWSTTQAHKTEILFALPLPRLFSVSKQHRHTFRQELDVFLGHPHLAALQHHQKCPKACPAQACLAAALL